MKQVLAKRLKIASAVWAGCAALSLAAYMFVLSPQDSTRQQLRRQLLEKKQLYEAAVEAAQDKNRVQLQQQLRRLSDRLAAFVVDPEASADLTLDISEIANERAVSALSIAGKGKVTSAGAEIPGCKLIKENKIKLSFQSGFPEFAGFLNTLERHRPVVFIDTFQIVRSEDDRAGHKVEMELAVLVGSKKQDKGDNSEQAVSRLLQPGSADNAPQG